MPPAVLNFWLVIMFKAGEARGRQELKVVLEEPSGLTGQMQVSHPVLFEGLDRGVTRPRMPHLAAAEGVGAALGASAEYNPWFSFT